MGGWRVSADVLGSRRSDGNFYVIDQILNVIPEGPTIVGDVL